MIIQFNLISLSLSFLHTFTTCCAQNFKLRDLSVHKRKKLPMLSRSKQFLKLNIERNAISADYNQSGKNKQNNSKDKYMENNDE
jgi:hypothetical protein